MVLSKHSHHERPVMRVAYLVNQYPKTSHSFIRREIRGVEEHGVEVQRYSVRAVAEPLVDSADIEERTRTRILLQGGARGIFDLFRALITALFTRPAKLARAASAAVRLARGSQKSLLHHLAYLAEACILQRWTRADAVDHVHAHFGTNAAAVALLCHALGGPTFSFTVHSPLSSEVPELCALREKIERASFVCAVSQHGKSQILRWTRPEEWSKVHLVRCGTDDVFRALRSIEVPETPRLLCVARMSGEKGHTVLLRAAAALATHGHSFELHLVGDGPLRPRLEAECDRLGLREIVRFRGWMSGDQVRSEIQSARALVLPSFVEGLPVVAMESFALERPVIATWVGGVPELVVPGINGWLVSPGDVDALAEACEEALTRAPRELWEMGRRGAESVALRHDSEREASKLMNLFQRPQGKSEAA